MEFAGIRSSTEVATRKMIAPAETSTGATTSSGMSRLRLSLLHRGRDRVEGHNEVGADQLHRSDDHDGDERSDQAVLDGSGAALVPKEREDLLH